MYLHCFLSEDEFLSHWCLWRSLGPHLDGSECWVVLCFSCLYLPQILTSEIPMPGVIVGLWEMCWGRGGGLFGGALVLRVEYHQGELWFMKLKRCQKDSFALPSCEATLINPCPGRRPSPNHSGILILGFQSSELKKISFYWLNPARYFEVVA